MEPKASSLPLSELIWIGKIIKPHGIKGNLKAYFDTDLPPTYYLSHKFLYLASPVSTIARCYVVHHIATLSPTSYILALKGVKNREEAEQFRGFSLFVPMEILPPLEKETEFYLFEIEECTVWDTKYGAVGKVIEVIDIPGNPLAKVKHPEGYTFLLPLQREVALTLDREKKILHVQLPNGLLEIYKPSSLS